MNKTDLPKAVIVDIDGTLAKMNGRGPFEWDRVGEDKVNEPIKRLVILFYACGYKVLLFSGRDECCRTQTIEWLYDNYINFTMLAMRPRGNNEKDAIIKRRLYNDRVAGKFDVKYVLDDRNQVVDMWRKELGLTCLQVDYGDF